MFPKLVIQDAQILDFNEVLFYNHFKIILFYNHVYKLLYIVNVVVSRDTILLIVFTEYTTYILLYSYLYLLFK